MINKTKLLILCLVCGCLQSCESPSSASSPEGQNDFLVYAQVLGIAQDAGYPQINCSKACCANIQQSETKGAHVSCVGLVDQKAKKSWLLDVTPDLVAQWSQLDPHGNTPVAGMFPTHAHIGHYTGLMYLGHESMGATEMPVYVMPRMDTFLRTNGPWSQLVAFQNISLMRMQNEQANELSEAVEIMPITVPHRDEFSETVGFIVRGPNKKLLYLPDINKWEKWEQNIEDWVAQVDYALLDGTFFDGNELPNRDMDKIPHPFVVESMERFQSLSAAEKAKIYFIHFNHTNPLLHRESNAVKKVEQAGHNVAYEGMVLEL